MPTMAASRTCDALCGPRSRDVRLGDAISHTTGRSYRRKAARSLTGGRAATTIHSLSAGSDSATALVLDLNLTPAEETFRREFASWLSTNLPEEYRASRLRGRPELEVIEVRRAWERRLGGAGWLGVSWPKEYGGRG